MTNSAITNSENEDQKEETNQQNTSIQIDPLTNTFVKLEPKVAYQPQNVGSNNVQTNSYFDWNQEISMKDTYDTLFKSKEQDYADDLLDGDDGDFNFYSEVNFDPSKELTSIYLASNKEDEEQNNSHISDGALNYVGYKRYIQNNLYTKPFGQRGKFQKEAIEIFEKHTGVDFLNVVKDGIPLNVVEGEKFQEGLNKVIQEYESKGIEWDNPDRNNLRQWVRDFQGLGLEISGGISTDILTAPLLKMGPWGIGANVLINAGVGWELNVAAQKARLGDQAQIGFADQINYGEAFAAAVVQAIPFGSTAKGWEGIRQSGLFGGTLAGTELTIRKLIDEKKFPSVKEYFQAIGLGAGFGATFRGTLNQLEKYMNKFADKNADEINKLITKKDKPKLNKIFETLSIFKKAVDENPEVKANVDADDIDVSNVNFKKGQVEPEVKNLDQSIDNKAKTKFNIGEVNLGEFVLPKGYLKMSPRYGSATLEFNSDIDKVAYILRANRVKLTEKQKITQERLTKLLEDQGIDVNAVRNHGVTVHKKIKDLVTAETGSAKASPDNTGGLKINVPTDQAFVKKNSTKTVGTTQDLGRTDLNPTQTVLLKYVDEPSVTNLRNLTKALKDKGWTSLSSETDKETLLKALALFDPNEPDLAKKIISLENASLIEQKAQEIENFHGITKQKEVNTALAISAVLASEKMDSKNNAFLNALNQKNPEQIETAIVELSESINDMKKWLMSYLVPSSRAGQTLQKLNIEPKKGMEGKTVAEYVASEKIQPSDINEEKLANVLDEVAFSAEDLKKDLTRQLEISKTTGDYSELYRIGKIIQTAEAEPETLFGLTKVNAFKLKENSAFNKTLRIGNEIGINGMLYRFGTNTANFISATLNTYHRQLKLFYGAENPEMFEAAIRHLGALHSNYHFMRQAYKKSMKLEDNFINLGNRKFENKFAIKSDDVGIKGQAINTTGKVIRFSGRNMTATDAMVQAPNLIADIVYMSFLEAKRQGLKGEDIGKFINKHKMAVLEWYAQNGGTELEPLTKRFLLHAKKQAKFATFTQDIDTTGPFGQFMKFGDDKANQFPLVRLFLSFTRTPTNIKSANFRNNVLFTPVVNPFNKQQSINYPDQIPILGGKNINPLSEAFIPELRKQLNSPDPKIRAIANADINDAVTLVSSIAGFSVAANMLMSDPTFIPPIILTGGGPDFGKEQGKNMWINMYKNGWRPYSVGFLQKDANGEPLIGNDGKPVYLYRSYEGAFEPFSGTVKMLVDTTNSLGLFGGKPYDDLTTGMVLSVVQNFYNDSWTSQVEEFINIFRDASAPVDASGDPIKNYRFKKFSDYVGRFIASRGPFSGLMSDLRRYPHDILRVMGFSFEEIEQIQRRPDTKVRAGDVLRTDDPTDPNYETSGDAAILSRAILNQFKQKYGIGPDIPFDVEHITNDPILYPNRIGGNVFGFSVTKKSKNYPIWTALAQIGRRIQEPSEYITGDMTKDEFVPIRLNTQQYNALKVNINTMKLNVGYGDKTIMQSMNAYLKSSEYTSNKKIIEEEGLNSQLGQQAANGIFAELTFINKSYIQRAEQNYIQKNFSDQEQESIMNYKSGIQSDYADKFLNSLNN